MIIPILVHSNRRPLVACNDIASISFSCFCFVLFIIYHLLVKIVIECSDGTYGYNCENNCSGHCMNNTLCNKQTGHCDGGCNPGYTNAACSKSMLISA